MQYFLIIAVAMKKKTKRNDNNFNEKIVMVRDVVGHVEFFYTI